MARAARKRRGNVGLGKPDSTSRTGRAGSAPGYAHHDVPHGIHGKPAALTGVIAPVDARAACASTMAQHAGLSEGALMHGKAKGRAFASRVMV